MTEQTRKIPVSQIQRLEPDSVLYLTDGTHYLTVRKDNEKLNIQVSHEEKTVFAVTILPNSQVHLIFTPSLLSSPDKTKPDFLPEMEQAKEPDYPPITLEGVPVRGAKFDREKQKYTLILAHHPDPKDRKIAVYYEITAEGLKAEELYKAYVTDSRVPVRVTGHDHSYTQTRKGKPEKMVRLIQAESIEKIQERWDSPEILPEKVRLADL